MTEKEYEKALEELYNRIEDLITARLNLNAWFDKLDKRIEAIGIKNDLIHESYMDMMVLIKLHHQKIKELEKRLEAHPELKQS